MLLQLLHATSLRSEECREVVERQPASSSFLTSRLAWSTANNRLTMLLDHITSASYPDLHARSSALLRCAEAPGPCSNFPAASSRLALLVNVVRSAAPGYDCCCFQYSESFISLLQDSTDGKETVVVWQPSGSQDLATRIATLAKRRQAPDELTNSPTFKDLRDLLMRR